MATRATTMGRVLVPLYFVSGVLGLIDEVIFSKYLSLAFGATAYASSAVLVAFMGGLAIGAAAMARFDARVARPLFVYGTLEVFVGCACAVAPWLFASVTRTYAAIAVSVPSPTVLELVRGALGACVVLLPTAAMGATLPLVARIARDASFETGQIALLYGANTAGGAAGALLGAYVIIPSLGLAASLRAGACVSVAIGVTAVVLGRRLRGDPVGVARHDRPPADWRLIAAAAASGALVFATEVVFVHLLALVDGTSVYVFGLVLSVFLVALSIGATLSRALRRSTGDNAAAVSLAVSGLALAATIPLWDRLPHVFVAVGPAVTSWTGREAVRGAVAALGIGVPAVCMGTTFPVVLGALGSRDDCGAQIGRATAVNTIASIGGSLVGGFVLLPWLGSQRSCEAIALAYGATAMALAAPAWRRIGALAMLTSVVVVATPRWDLASIASGANIYFERQPEQGRVVQMDEDVHGGVVTVTRNGDIHTLWTNGKYQGDDGPQMTAQRAFADIPAMFVRRFGRALVIGLGTGTTLGALAAYPFESIDLAELSPGIVNAARTFFARTNGGVLDDPRVSIHIEDGRNMLLVEPRTYDLVTIELTSIWFAGAANLYSREFYATAARRLNDRGVVSQWIQLHHTTLREIASQLATARAVFRHAVFFIRGDQGVLVLGGAPLFARPHEPDELDDLVLADATIDQFVDDVCVRAKTTRDAIVSTDDDRRLEYATPRNNVPGMPSIAEMAAAIRTWRRAEIAEQVIER